MQLGDQTRFASAIATVTVLCVCLQTCCCQDAVTSCQLGDCIGYLRCPILRSALSLVGVKSSKAVIEIVKQHRCGDRESRSVCCTDLAADLVRNNILANFTDEDSAIGLAHLMTTPCGKSDRSDRLGNAVTAFLFEFPWMALLEYNTTEGSRFQCAGSLISNRYVLTAAHCFTSTDSQLVNVRLGEYDTSKEIDCDVYGGGTFYCAPPVQDHGIEDVLIHSDFQSGFVNDIALVRLKGKVAYGYRILPICLPVGEDSIRTIGSATSAGWGYATSGNTSDVLQKSDLTVLPADICRDISARNLSSSHTLCAGGRRRMDTCRGDSGGPLFVRDTNGLYTQYGVLSGGGELCGGNNTVPSIYTNVADYVPWIVKHMKP